MRGSGKPGTATAPPTLGEGCTSRYDPEALSEEDGTEFPGAAQLWSELQGIVEVPEGASAQGKPAPK